MLGRTRMCLYWALDDRVDTSLTLYNALQSVTRQSLDHQTNDLEPT